jgi:OOP family OmpA-OmpF porin
MKNLVVLAVIVLVAVWCAPSFAEITEGSFEITPYVGALFGDSVGDQTESGVQFDSDDMDDSVSFGVRAGYNFTPVFGIEGSLGYVPDTDFTGTATDGVNTVNYDVGSDQLHFHLNAVCHFWPEKELVPYLTAGIGGVRFDGDVTALGVSEDYDETDFAWNFGGGAKWALTERVAVRVDVRDIITSMEDLDTMHMIETTAGLTFSF